MFANSGRALQFEVNQVLNRSTVLGASTLNNFFNTTNLNRLSVNSTGQTIPLQQFFGNQIMAQASNTFGSLASSFQNQASSLLFQNGATVTPTTSALNSFGNSLNSAINTAAFQLAGNLSLLNGGNGLASSLQNNLFGSGNNSLIQSIGGIPVNSLNFGSNVATAFNNAFGSLATPVSNFFGMNSTSSTSLPTSNFTNMFTQDLASNNFNSGFNNGFGSGFVGFGTAPTSLNSNFGTGFNNFVTSTNQNFGVNGLSSLFGGTGDTTGTIPTRTGIGTGTGTSTGTGTLGTGTGTGTTTVGTGSGTSSSLTIEGLFGKNG